MKKIKSNQFKIGLLISCLVLTMFLSGCSLVSQPSANVGGPLGVYKSQDGALSWASKISLLNDQGKILTIGDVSVSKILLDPSDRNAVYLVTNKGLYYSYTGGEDWQGVSNFGTSQISDVAVDYFDKCNIFVALGQYIYRSTDCLRTWQSAYYDSRTDVQLTQIMTDHYNKTYLYAGNNKGEVLKSLDMGKTWQTIKRLNNPVKQLVIDADDSRIVYVLTQTAGIYKTADGGKTWKDDKPDTDINKGLDQFPESRTTSYMVQDSTKKNSYVFASKYGLLKTADGGATWQAIPLITPERSANIFGLAIDPKNAKIIYYTTENTIYKSVDAGKNWSTQKSPTSGMANFLLIDPQDTNIIYLGAKAITK
ncbi:MAG: YCF48-related protein [Patescibacteria group bacterium]|nr:YCF48-related protein [Patescibacteria group bacterium]